MSIINSVALQDIWKDNQISGLLPDNLNLLDNSKLAAVEVSHAGESFNSAFISRGSTYNKHACKDIWLP